MQQSKLKVLAWNVWHEGHSEKYGPKACEATLGIIKASEADIVLMIETYGASAQVADALGYYHRLLSSNLSIYSRYPITNTLVYPDSTIAAFNFGGVEIDMNGKKIRIFDTWLHHLPDCRLAPLDKSAEDIIAWDDAGTRDDEVRAILSAIKPYLDEADSIPIIMGGDFNSHSHLDWTEETKNLYNHGGQVVNWTVSSEMLKAGFKDSFREINPDPVKDLGITWMYPQGEDKASKPWRCDRIDYIYYKGSSIRAVDSEIQNKELGEILNFKGKEFFYASDHGFVLSSFEIT